MPKRPSLGQNQHAAADVPARPQEPVDLREHRGAHPAVGVDRDDDLARRRPGRRVADLRQSSCRRRGRPWPRRPARSAPCDRCSDSAATITSTSSGNGSAAAQIESRQPGQVLLLVAGGNQDGESSAYSRLQPNVSVSVREKSFSLRCMGRPDSSAIGVPQAQRCRTVFGEASAASRPRSTSYRSRPSLFDYVLSCDPSGLLLLFRLVQYLGHFTAAA